MRDASGAKLLHGGTHTLRSGQLARVRCTGQPRIPRDRKRLREHLGRSDRVIAGQPERVNTTTGIACRVPCKILGDLRVGMPLGRHRQPEAHAVFEADGEPLVQDELHHLIRRSERREDMRIEMRLHPDDSVGSGVGHHLSDQAAHVLRPRHAQVEGRLEALLEPVEPREDARIRDRNPFLG
jgi:hypothetical protein